MKKIPSVFKRDYLGTRLVYDEVVSGSEWVLAGEGVPTEKVDGTSCMVRGGVLYKRFDRKRWYDTLNPKPAPPGWEPCEPEPNEHTGHWPGWVPVGDGPEDAYHREAMIASLPDGTYELLGPKVQGNPYGLPAHHLYRHGSHRFDRDDLLSFGAIRSFLAGRLIEGIVWHHPDGRMAKIKRKDFGLPWPVDNEQEES